MTSMHEAQVQGTQDSTSDVEGGHAIVPTPYNLARARSDTWHRLRDAARRLRMMQSIDFDEEHAALRLACRESLDNLSTLEPYYCFPGRRIIAYLRHLFDETRYTELASGAIRVVRMLSTDAYRRLDLSTLQALDILDLLKRGDSTLEHLPLGANRPYFEVLVVDDIDEVEEAQLRFQMRALRTPEDAFTYEIVVARTLQDAVLAVLANPNLQAAILRYSFPFGASPHQDLFERAMRVLGDESARIAQRMPGERTQALGQLLSTLRPELDLYRVTSAPAESLLSEKFRRVFFRSEDLNDLHVSLLHGVHERYKTPFFRALKEYSERPTGMFHALPVSRASSVAKSHWIHDLATFYSKRIFMAETSATTGGLDSLLQPTGSLKVSQELAARAFGADRTFFVTNGTSTANKIVMQALMRPSDIILLSHDCHKSHPYTTILSGVYPVYLDAYPLTEFSMYGGVALDEIKRQLLALKRAGKLHRVRLLLLTNLTFDGITYDPYRVMKEVLAIKPDMLFLWDEAWFAYGRFSPTLRRRTAMDAAARLERELLSPDYAERYAAYCAEHDRLDPDDERTYVGRSLLPDPSRARVRVYATQSTHKTLTALRQGSMIHVRDVDFERSAEGPFHEAYMTHTSTSPNYQILATLDVGRRQGELEGYEFVTASLELSFLLRERVNEDPLLARYFRILTPKDMVPAEYRPSTLERYFDPKRGLGPIEEAWLGDEFVLDPTRVTLHVGRTGMDGDTFKKLLMDKYAIHINKTSRNTVLFLVHIGTGRGAIAHLVKVLTQIASELERQAIHSSEAELCAFADKVDSLTRRLPPLPNFSCFHPAFRPDPAGSTPEGDIRRAFYAAYEEVDCEYLPLDTRLRERVLSQEQLVSAAFITPYPPGFPILVPGQVLSLSIIDYLLALDVKEIHGYEPDLGLRVFSQQALERCGQERPREALETTASRLEFSTTVPIAGVGEGPSPHGLIARDIEGPHGLKTT